MRTVKGVGILAFLMMPMSLVAAKPSLRGISSSETLSDDIRSLSVPGGSSSSLTHSPSPSSLPSLSPSPSPTMPQVVKTWGDLKEFITADRKNWKLTWDGNNLILSNGKHLRMFVPTIKSKVFIGNVIKGETVFSEIKIVDRRQDGYKTERLSLWQVMGLQSAQVLRGGGLVVACRQSSKWYLCRPQDTTERRDPRFFWTGNKGELNYIPMGHQAKYEPNNASASLPIATIGNDYHFYDLNEMLFGVYILCFIISVGLIRACCKGELPANCFPIQPNSRRNMYPPREENNRPHAMLDAGPSNQDSIAAIQWPTNKDKLSSLISNLPPIEITSKNEESCSICLEDFSAESVTADGPATVLKCADCNTFVHTNCLRGLLEHQAPVQAHHCMVCKKNGEYIEVQFTGAGLVESASQGGAQGGSNGDPNGIEMPVLNNVGANV